MNVNFYILRIKCRRQPILTLVTITSPSLVRADIFRKLNLDQQLNTRRTVEYLQQIFNIPKLSVRTAKKMRAREAFIFQIHLCARIN